MACRGHSFVTTDVFLPFFIAAVALGANSYTTKTEAAEIVTRANAVVMFKGEIVDGDAARLDRALRSISKAQYDRCGRVLLSLNSEGGDWLEGLELGAVLERWTRRGLRIDTFVPWDAECASSCVSLFAVGKARHVGLAGATRSGKTVGNGKVFVHSASVNGEENDQSLHITVIWARVLTETGAPASVVGKLVSTRPEDVTALSGADLGA